VRLAVLDVGSNTVHLVVVDGKPDGTFVPVARERDTLRLAEAAFPGRFLPDEAVDRLIASVKQKRQAADRLHAEALVGFATSAIREARNGADALGRVREATGVSISVLSGVEEARLTYYATRRWTAFSANRLLVVDIGGGSLEVAGGEGDRPELVESLPLGVARLTRRFLRSDPPREDELAALRVHALAVLGPLAERVRDQPWEVVCATSKTFRNLGVFARALPEAPTPPHAFGFAGVDGQTAPVLTREALNVAAGYIASSNTKERAKLNGGQDGQPVEDPRRRAVLEFARRNGWDEPHSRQVTKLALSLFDQTAELHELGPSERELLEVAGLLHDVGFAVAQSSHHKHSLYLIRNADLDGFGQEELAVIANVARYHRKALPSERHPDFQALSEGERLLVRRLAALLRIADGLDADHFQVVQEVEVHLEDGIARLDLRARDLPDRDVWAAEQGGDLFEKEFGRRLELVPVEVV
jgi:exopolyphosphatase / guanosine-5'-triphosphate,3'-diphosphate pyrophosphatase